MKNVKRALAMCLTLALLLSCSPVFNVSATGTESESDAPPAYGQLKDHYDLFSEDDFSDENKTVLSSISAVKRYEDAADGNPCLKFTTVHAKAANVNYKYMPDKTLPDNCANKKIIFEADIRWDNPGLQIVFNARTLGKNIMYLQNGTLNFKSASGDTTVNLAPGEWHTITYVMDLDAGVFSAFVEGIQIIDNKPVVDDEFIAIGAIRFIIKEPDGANAAKVDERDFYVDNVKWYTYRECTDDDNDGYCDYGCGKRTQYAVNEDGAIVNANGEVLTEITASGVLDLNGQSTTISVTGANTKLSVVDTSFMLDNGNLDLTGDKAGRLKVTEGADKIENWTQYGDYKYLKAQNTDGSYSFHPFNLVITKVGLNTIKEAICFQVTFIANNVVRDKLLLPGNDYGIYMLADGEKEESYISAKACENASYKFNENVNGIRPYFDLSDSLKIENFDVTREFKAYIKIDNVEILSNYTLTINPREIMKTINNVAQPSDAQLERIHTMMVTYPHLNEVLTNFVPKE